MPTEIPLCSNSLYINGLAGNEEELNELSQHLDMTAKASSIKTNAKKTKMMKNNAEGMRGDIWINDKRLETISPFKYLEGIVTDEGSKPEILSRITQAMHAMS